MATNYGTFNWPGSVSSNPSVGTNGSTAPTQSTEVSGVDPSGNLQPLQVDASKNLKVTIAGGLANPLPVMDAAAEASLASIDTKTPAKGQATMANSQPVAIASDQSSVPVTVGNFPATQPVSGTVTVVQPAGTNLHAVIDSGTVAVSNFPGTQPVSGTVTANQGTANTVANAWPVKNTDGTNTAAVKAASTAAVATDPALVVALSPNNNTLANALFVKNSDGTNTAAVKAASTAAASTDPALVVALSPNNNTLSNALFIKNTDGTNTAAVKAASAAPVATDPALVVAISPNSTAVVNPKGYASSSAPIYNNYATTNITTSAYTQLIASTTSATTWIDIFDSSGQGMILATGGAGSEVVQAYIPPGGDEFSFAIPAGTRVAYKALTATASSGYLLLNLRG